MEFKRLLFALAERVDRCKRFRGKFHNTVSSRKQQSCAAVAGAHVRPAQPVLEFGLSGVPDFVFLEYFPEFCHEGGVRGHVDVNLVVEYFFEAWRCFCEIYG